ncbi:MAG: hypothetical protein HY481_02480 [Candidatus Vogelbacteria bacterium]|nr:hypothetical protein [Candidatus Vogelbacteria bacterium]
MAGRKDTSEALEYRGDRLLLKRGFLPNGEEDTIGNRVQLALDEILIKPISVVTNGTNHRRPRVIAIFPRP